MIKPRSMAPEPLSLYINHLRFISNNDGKIKLKNINKLSKTLHHIGKIVVTLHRKKEKRDCITILTKKKDEKVSFCICSYRSCFFRFMW